MLKNAVTRIIPSDILGYMSQDDSQEHPPADPAQNLPAVNKAIKYKLSRKYKKFADTYLLTLNATEAYKIVFKPKCPEYAYKNAYKLLRIEGISRYVDEALASSCEANYRPEAIKEGIQTLAQTSRRESDRLRAYELMSKISGLINEGQATQVNFFDSDIMALARKRLSERKKDSQKPVVIDTESSQVIETKAESESVLPTNTDAKTDEQIDGSKVEDMDAGEGMPQGGVGEGPPATP